MTKCKSQAIVKGDLYALRFEISDSDPVIGVIDLSETTPLYGTYTTGIHKTNKMKELDLTDSFAM